MPAVYSLVYNHPLKRKVLDGRMNTAQWAESDWQQRCKWWVVINAMKKKYISEETERELWWGERKSAYYKKVGRG